MTLTTPWSVELDSDHPLPEYPRPQLTRLKWLNLNGRWEYAIRPAGEQRVDAFDGQIVVPFAVESALSGVQKPLRPDQQLWYKRTFQVPDSWNGNRILLHFDAVDWHCNAWVNGHLAGEHTGGYLPFIFDISPHLHAGDNELLVVVDDPTNTGQQEYGKQSLRPRAIWYTAVSGIWQTVWLEPVPQTSIRTLKMTPDLAGEQLIIEAVLDGDIEGLTVEAAASFGGMPVAQVIVPAGKSFTLTIPHPQAWSPEKPNLYDLLVHLKKGRTIIDEVGSYFAMRSFSFDLDAKGHKRFLLNGQPTFLFGPLDQGYWPDGLYTAPSDDALRFDIEFTKDIGCNLIRKHVKVEPPRWYYHCDRLGMLVWQDMPNGGIPPTWSIAMGPILFKNTHSNEKDLKRFGREDAGNRDRFLHDLQATLEHLYNTACIAAWAPFNEAWGQFSARSVAEMLQLWDPTRSVDHASGWFDEGAGDWRSLHIYGFKLSPGKPDERAFVLSEFGGFGLRLNGHLWHHKRKFGLHYFKDEGKLATAYADLLEKQLEPLISQGLVAAVYTQVTDVEIEMNGWLTYDRRVEKIPRATLKALHARLFTRAQAELKKS